MADKKNKITEDNESKQVQVYNSIKEDILNGTFPPGTIMVERKLCDIYNVSRSPIRNALANLARDGLLVFSQGKGMMVPEITLEDIFEIYDLMEMFQKYAVRVSIKKLNSVMLNTLENLLHNIRVALDEEHVLDAIKWDIKFHEFLIDLSGSSMLKVFYNQLAAQILRFLSATITDMQLAERSYNEHRGIYECLKNNDLEGAEKNIEAHYSNTKQYYINRLISREL